MRCEGNIQLLDGGSCAKIVKKVTFIVIQNLIMTVMMMRATKDPARIEAINPALSTLTLVKGPMSAVVDIKSEDNLAAVVAEVVGREAVTRIRGVVRETDLDSVLIQGE